MIARQMLLAGLAGVLIVTSASAADQEPFKIGVIVPFSGPHSLFGQGMSRGVELAVQMRGGKVLGRPIEIITTDNETKPQVSAQRATELATKRVDIMLGASESSSTYAIKSIADQRKIPLLVTQASDPGMTSRNGSPYLFRTNTHPDADILGLVELAKAKGWKKIYGLSSDYKAIRALWDGARKGFDGAGITVVGEDFVPFGAQDMSVFIDKASRIDADAINVWIAGNDAITFLKQAAQAGLTKTRATVGVVYIEEAEAAAVGPGSLGAFSGLRYHFTLDNPRSKQFVANWKAKYDSYPASYSGDAFDGMSWFLDVIDRTGSSNNQDWIKAFETSTWSKSNSIIGQDRKMRACDHQSVQPSMWGVVVEGKPPLPALTMKFDSTFDTSKALEPC